MKRFSFITIFLLFVSLNCFAASGGIFEIWKGVAMPEGVSQAGEKAFMRKDGCFVVFDTAVPTLEVFWAKNAKSDKPVPAVVICPGGGYWILAYNKEGTAIAEALAERGITAAVLKYRTPRLRAAALCDARRAIRFVRANAAAWNVDPNKVAIMGFSAGANLSARASANHTQEVYSRLDSIDDFSARPDFTGLIYPAYCDAPTFEMHWGGGAKADLSKLDYNAKYALAPELKVDATTPPAFIMQAQDDSNWVNASVAYFLALKENNVPATLHFFEKGGHGFGLGADRAGVCQWFGLFAKWLEYQCSKSE